MAYSQLVKIIMAYFHLTHSTYHTCRGIEIFSILSPSGISGSSIYRGQRITAHSPPPLLICVLLFHLSVTVHRPFTIHCLLTKSFTTLPLE
jgi:hypothetical protein